MREASARAVFDEALELPPEMRSAHISARCGADAALRTKVEGLLVALGEAGEFLAGPASSTGTSELQEGPGARIGPYMILQLIGEGGFGSVFLAEQERPVSRRVALKITKLGMDTRAVIARFEAERQALAMMDHPSIAKVFDAGATDTGRPYFVMELVTGEPVTRYCDRNRLSIAQRLDLFRQICHAVQHAHQKGVIHRDIKPNNILVSTQDERPLAKVIDFGIAKATATRLTEKTLFTEHHQLIGTPEYMSPEQAEGGIDIDTRTDVYSLGVLLYELLTGLTPFDPQRLRSAAFAEIQRIIREEDPEKPSTRLSLSRVQLAAVAAHRQVEPRKLSTIMQGDLDWIVMMCLEKDRARRYETADALAADIERHLVGEPVIAAPPSRVYRARKFLKRNRSAAFATVVVAAVMIAGIFTTRWQAARATSQRNLAVAAQQRTLKVKGLLERMLTASNPLHNTLKGGAPQTSLRPDVKLIDVLDQVAPVIDGEFRDQPEVEADVRFAIGKSYYGLSRFTESRAQLERALELYQKLLSPDDPRTLECLNILGFNYWWVSEPDRAERAFREALAGYERRNPSGPEAIDARVGLAIFLYNYTNNVAEAVRLAREALALRRQFAPEESRDVFMAKTTLAHVLQSDDRTFQEADLLAAEALEQCLRTPLSRSTGDEWFCRINALDCARHFGRFGEAEELGRNLVRVGDEVAGPDSFMGTLARTRLARCLLDQKRLTEAIELFRQSLASQMSFFGADNGHTMDTASGLAACYFEQWQIDPEQTALLDQAEPLALQAATWIAADPHLRGQDGIIALIVHIYEARDAVEPGKGFDEQARLWRDKLASWQAATQPGAPAPEGSSPH